jgi:hypothetical protein
MMISKLLLPTYRQMLNALSSWLTKAQAQIDKADTLMSARLAPDMFPLSTQVRFACYQAHEGTYRLQNCPLPATLEDLASEGRSGGERPGTIAEAQTRIDEALVFLDSLDEDSLNSGAARSVSLELPIGIAFDLTGEQYVRDWALPQFYFHIMSAYTILRNQGIELGKADYVEHMFAYQRTGTEPTA